jgi:hypothetical protein
MIILFKEIINSDRNLNNYLILLNAKDKEN